MEGSMESLRGVFVVTVTPLTEDGEVDLPGLRRNAEWLIGQGVHGLVPLGSTGEFASLQDDDKRKIVTTVIETAAGRVPIVVGATAETTERAIENACFAQKAGAAGVLVLPPYYYIPDQDELWEHYRRIAEAIQIPIMIYNNPFSSKVDIKPETVAKLSQLQNIGYIKESSGDIKRITEIRMCAGDQMTVFCGWEDMAYESFVMGAKGWVCVIGNILPKAAVELYDLVVVRKDLEDGWELYRRMLPMLRHLEYAGKTQKVLKYALDGMGLAGGRSFSPKLPLSGADKAVIDALLREFREW
jgi:4-hydroxy-tetrahydrodipicolinate synthase